MNWVHCSSRGLHGFFELVFPCPFFFFLSERVNWVIFFCLRPTLSFECSSWMQLFFSRRVCGFFERLWPRFLGSGILRAQGAHRRRWPCEPLQAAGILWFLLQAGAAPVDLGDALPPQGGRGHGDQEGGRDGAGAAPRGELAPGGRPGRHPALWTGLSEGGLWSPRDGSRGAALCKNPPPPPPLPTLCLSLSRTYHRVPARRREEGPRSAGEWRWRPRRERESPGSTGRRTARRTRTGRSTSIGTRAGPGKTTRTRRERRGIVRVGTLTLVEVNPNGTMTRYPFLLCLLADAPQGCMHPKNKNKKKKLNSENPFACHVEEFMDWWLWMNLSVFFTCYRKGSTMALRTSPTSTNPRKAR